MPGLQQIINSFNNPVYGQITRDPGAIVLTAGLTQCMRIVGPINVDAVGFSFSFVTIPAEFGRFAGVTWEYERRIVQWACVYHTNSSLADPGGHDFYAPFTDVYREGEYFFWPQLLPTRIDVYVTVGCTVAIDWLLVF